MIFFQSDIAMLPSVSSSIQNPSSLSVSPNFNQNHLDSIISSFLSFPDVPALSTSSSYDRLLDNIISSSDDSVHDHIIDRILERVSLLRLATMRCLRKQYTLHNSNSWFLPMDLTIKVFSMLDTKSLMQASACCKMFNNCAMEPLCYSHIDLTTASKPDDCQVLRTMIHRSGKQLRSIKFGHVVNPGHYTSSPTVDQLFSSSCSDINGNLLKSLHIYYHLTSVDISSLCAALSACPNLTDLKIVKMQAGVACFIRPGIKVTHDKLLLDRASLLRQPLLGSSFLHCDMMTSSTIEAFVTNCPKLTSLTLLSFGLSDAMAQILVRGLRKLKYMNLSKTSGINGSFLRDLGLSCKDSLLETLILRECFSLEEREVLEFLNSLIAGHFKFIRCIDISCSKGLDCGQGERTSNPNFPLEKLKEERSNVTFVADFPSIIEHKLRFGYSTSGEYEEYASEDEDYASEDEDYG